MLTVLIVFACIGAFFDFLGAASALASERPLKDAERIGSFMVCLIRAVVTLFLVFALGVKS